MLGVWKIRVVAIGLIALGMANGNANATDLLTNKAESFSKNSLYRPDRWEVRGGAFAHGVGSLEKGSTDINFEVVVPRMFAFSFLPEFFTPRFHLGGMANFVGRTSYGYAGLLFTYNITERLFAEPFVGVAISNGVADGDATHNAIGCTTLIHSGGNVGYRFNQNWSAMFTFDHLSNGKLCSHNVGVNNYGARIGYNF